MIQCKIRKAIFRFHLRETKTAQSRKQKTIYLYKLSRWKLFKLLLAKIMLAVLSFMRADCLWHFCVPSLVAALIYGAQ